MSARSPDESAVTTASRVSGGRTPRRFPFEYAIVRVVPRVERGESVNAGVLVFCRPLQFLAVRTAVDEARLRALWPELDVDGVRRHLHGIERAAAGDADAGPIAQLDTTERFHWLVAPASTIVQAGPVHTGLTDDPAGELLRLFAKLVER